MIIKISQVAFLYYKKGLSQKEIGELFGLSKMTISRMLQKAKSQKIVITDVAIPFKFDKNLEKKIEQKYKIDKVIVLRKENKIKTHDLLGKYWAFYMGICDLNNKVIGMGVGNTIGSMVRYITPIKTKNTQIIQIMGGLVDISYSNPFTIVQEMSDKLQARGHFLTSMAAVDNEEIKNNIMSSSYLNSIKFNKFDMAIFGIGSFGKGTLLSKGLVKEEEFKELIEKGAVGDILGHCFDSKGDLIESSLESRIVSLPLDKIKKFKKRVALAGENYKKEAIVGALLSGIINILVTEDKLAKSIV